MTGAAILSCRAALRAGAGLVHLAGPASLNPILETALPEVITIPLPDEDGHLGNIEDARLQEAMERAVSKFPDLHPESIWSASR